ncbi:MAG: DUF6438 domain-containing protein [Polyangiaceae bacterium]
MPQALRNSRRWFWQCVACIALIGVAACGKKKPPADTTSIDQPHPPDTVPGATALATLERTGCYGECPVYRLTVSGDGSVIYVGTRWVKVKGRQQYKLSEAQLSELQAAFERANFLQLHDYDHVESTDDDWAHVSLRRGNTVKRVRHYHGDNAAPPALGVLEDEFDRIVGSAQFVGGQAASGAAASPAATGVATPAATGAAAPAATGGAATEPPATAPSAHSARPTVNDNAGPPDEAVADPDNHP